MLSDEQFEFAKDCVLLEQWMINHGYKFTYGETWRPDEMQEIYFKKGLSKVKTRGAHGNRLARDYNFWIKNVYLDLGKEDPAYIKQNLQPIGDFWEMLSPQNTWGGNWNDFFDPGHFERRR